MVTVSPRTLKTLAALVWYTGGIILLLKGRSLLLEADAMQPGHYWFWLAPVAGLVIGGLKGTFIFRKSCRKNLARIDALESPKVWQFFRPWFFLALLAMILTGATLSRLAHGDYAFLIGVAVLDFSIATALLLSSLVFWRQKILSPSRR